MGVRCVTCDRIVKHANNFAGSTQLRTTFPTAERRGRLLAKRTGGVSPSCPCLRLAFAVLPSFLPELPFPTKVRQHPLAITKRLSKKQIKVFL